MSLLEDYAMIGDRRTAALIDRTGSIDWLCLPGFDDAACFAALLGDERHGRWLIGPDDPAATTTRRYDGDSLVLITTHRTDTGSARVTDAMPDGDHRTDVVRRIEGIDGTVRMRHEWLVRFGYGKIRPWVHRVPDESEHGCSEAIVAIAGPDLLELRGPRLPSADGWRHRDVFDVRAGDDLVFTMTARKSYEPAAGPVDVRARVRRTTETAQDWARQCTYTGPYREPVVRSLLTLRALTHAWTGGIAAAATTSLPEELGGERNWDYRFCWLRDAALTLRAMLSVGFESTALEWRDWLARAVAGDPEDLQIMYRLDGGRDLPERLLDHLPGYEGSMPVRIGNAAVGQRQTDVLGEVMLALDHVRRTGEGETRYTWNLQVALMDSLCARWAEPDNGVWEIRGPSRHFTHSRAMAWAALDRAVSGVERFGLPGPVERWRQTRDRIRDDVLERGYSTARGCFTQHYETTEVDAALLLIARTGLVQPTDERYVATIAAIEDDLMCDGFLMRYRPETGVDGVAGGDNPFLACSFWLVSAYAKTGRLDDAHVLMRRLIGVANDVGLLAEEYDPRAGRMLGNMPQAFSHLGLVLAAHDLALAESHRSSTAAQPRGDAAGR